MYIFLPRLDETPETYSVLPPICASHTCINNGNLGMIADRLQTLDCDTRRSCGRTQLSGKPSLKIAIYFVDKSTKTADLFREAAIHNHIVGHLVLNK